MEFYTYRIVDERGDSTPNPTAPEQIGEPNVDNPMQSKTKGGGGNGGHSLISLATFQKMASTTMSFASTHISTYMGSTAAQNRTNAGIQIAGTIISTIANPMAGTANLAISIAKRAMEIAEELRKDSIRTTEAQKRAGSNYNSSRL
ncbi:MAG: hypothetical protein RR338_00180 [Clostridia bacterium]